MVARGNGQQLGGASEVDLRQVWPDEAADFTPWLANNLVTLNQKLGLELREPVTEVRIGNVKADIVARSPDGGAAVIENQLSPSNHGHLGQLLTYVSGRDDVAVAIWVVSRLKPEHRRALARLNEWSPVGVDFYGVEVSAIRIDDSRPASMFVPVAFPGDWDVGSRNRGRADASSAEYTEFFDTLLAGLSPRGVVRGRRGRRDQLQVAWPSDPPEVSYRAQFLSSQQVAVALIIRGASAAETVRIFDQLAERRGRLEEALGASLQWIRQPNRPTSIVRRRGVGDIRGSEAELAEIRRWMAETIARLRSNCEPYLREIVATLQERVE